ncbi:uncharacterized protein LOC111325817 [Stylophora pistillata]|uniref:uncharacterized protein LOC111325817 n=1 Tax=Stylophora pistillata TaxID=50429 RepID=UPI000C0552D1|nr:uncharacterized protein LOC111325817 [Stylophora pistillata]
MKMLAITKETGDTEKEAEVYFQLGACYSFVGQKEQAVEFVEKSMQIRQTEEHQESLVDCLNLLANNLLSPGQAKEAFERLQKALQVSEENAGGFIKSIALMALGHAYKDIGEYDKAKEYYQRMIRVSEEFHVSNLGAMAYYHIAELLMELQQYEESMKSIEKALELCEESKLTEQTTLSKGDIYITLCKIHLLLGQHDKADECVKQILTENRPKNNLDRSVSLFQLGAFFSVNGKLEQACDIISESIKCYESERDLFNDEFKLSSGDMVEHLELYRHYCLLLVALGKPVQALCTAERARARLLAEMLAEKYAIREKAELSENDLSILLKSLNQNQIVVFIATPRGKRITFWIMKNDASLEMRNPKSANQDTPWKAYFESLSYGRSINSEDRSLLALYDIQSAADGTQHDRIREKRLFEDSDDEELEAQNLPNQLYYTLIAPIADRIQNREVVLVPEGSMAMVPFAALQDDSGKYLSDSCRVRIIPSLSTLKLILDSPENYHSQTGALIVGDPQVSHVTPLWQLKAARQEAREIANLLEVEPLLGEQATKEEVLRRIPVVCLIHIAAHGDAERGEIACAPNPSSPQIPAKEDYMLTMGDIASVRIRAKLVVLSCCHSAKGKIMQAEGVMGIARAFIASGARSVLVSLWAVDDKATKEFMIRFYGHLKYDKMSASEALHQTMKWMRESKTARYTVREWAPFVLIGDDVNLDV